VSRQFANEVRHRLGHHVKSINLFGSRARGDAREDSDYDMLVVVDQKTLEIRSIILDIEVELLEKYDVLVACVLQSEKQWNTAQGYPLARNIAKEGIPL